MVRGDRWVHRGGKVQGEARRIERMSARYRGARWLRENRPGEERLLLLPRKGRDAVPRSGCALAGANRACGVVGGSTGEEEAGGAECARGALKKAAS